MLKIKKNSLMEIVKSLLFRPIVMGLYGFAGFFVAIVISKYLGLQIGNAEKWGIDITDVMLSVQGFFLMFLFCFLTNFQKIRLQQHGRHNNI